MTGTGTLEDPYVILNVDDLYSMTSIGAYYRLDTDIDFNNTPYAQSFVPIPFKGLQLDGNGHTISNIYSFFPTTNANVFHTWAKSQAPVDQFICNLNMKNIYIHGKVINFFGWPGPYPPTEGSLNLSNCVIAMKCTPTAVQEFINSGSTDYMCLFGGKRKVLNFTDCTLAVDADLHVISPVFNRATFSRSQVKLNIRVFTPDAAADITKTLMFSTVFSDSYCFGNISYPPMDSKENYLNFCSKSQISNSYFVMDFSGYEKLVLLDSNVSNTCFYDKDIAGDVLFEERISGSSEPTPSGRLFALETEKCKSLSYLKSIGFLCEEGS